MKKDRKPSQFLYEIIPELKNSPELQQINKDGRCGTCRYFNLEFPNSDATLGSCSQVEIKSKYVTYKHIIDKMSWRCQFYAKRKN